MPEALKSRGSQRHMGQNTPYLCIAKRVTGHGVYSNLIQITPNTKSIKAGYRGNKISPQYPAFFHTHLKDRFIGYAVLKS